jgi:hypothetical protein
MLVMLHDLGFFALGFAVCLLICGQFLQQIVVLLTWWHWGD